MDFIQDEGQNHQLGTGCTSHLSCTKRDGVLLLTCGRALTTSINDRQWPVGSQVPFRVLRTEADHRGKGPQSGQPVGGLFMNRPTLVFFPHDRASARFSPTLPSPANTSDAATIDCAVFDGEWQGGHCEKGVTLIHGRADPSTCMQTRQTGRHGPERSLLRHQTTHLGSADGSNTQPQQETLIVRGVTREAGGCSSSNRRRGCGRLAVLCGLSLGLSKPSATNLLSRALGAQALPSFGYRRSLLAARGLWAWLLATGACTASVDVSDEAEKVPRTHIS